VATLKSNLTEKGRLRCGFMVSQELERELSWVKDILQVVSDENTGPNIDQIRSPSTVTPKPRCFKIFNFENGFSS
jgi:hypothetical protein